MTTITYKQISEVNSHWIWSACNHIISIANKYNIDCNYTSEKMPNEYYKITFEIPDNNIIREVISLYIAINLPELVKIDKK